MEIRKTHVKNVQIDTSAVAYNYLLPLNIRHTNTLQ